MLDVIPLMIARDRVRAGLEEPRAEPAPRRQRRHRRSAAAWLRALADRLEGLEAKPAGR